MSLNSYILVIQDTYTKYVFKILAVFWYFTSLILNIISQKANLTWQEGAIPGLKPQIKFKMVASGYSLFAITRIIMIIILMMLLLILLMMTFAVGRMVGILFLNVTRESL